MKYSFTINTDASYHPETQIGAWACWIKSSHYLIKEAGLFPGAILNSSVAELMAVEQALILLDKLIDSQEFLQHRRNTGDIVIYFNTDSMWSVHALRGIMKRSKHIAIARHIKSLTSQYEIVARHVKGHTKEDSARAWVNNWCDHQSRRLVRKEVAKRHERTTEKI